MALSVQRRDGSGERAVLTGMVVSRAVLGPIAVRWQKGLFASRWGNLVGGWCVEHYLRYHKAPGRDIEGYFDRWAERSGDRELTRLVEDYLGGLSEEYERLKKSVSPDYVLDVAQALFNGVRLSELRSLLESDLELGEVEKAMKRVAELRPVEIGVGAEVEVLSDMEAIESAFEQRGEVLVEYPDPLNLFFGGFLGRDQFVSFMGKEKVGKSFWLKDVAFRAVEQGRNTAYFEVGDNSQHQVLRLLGARAAERPVDAGSFYYPTVLDQFEEDQSKPKRGLALPRTHPELRPAEHGLTVEEAKHALRSLGKRVGADRLMLSCHPNTSISVRGLEAILDGWRQDGWVPDVVVVDYADILAPLDGRAETRDQINATWKALRAMSQRYHCLVVTATQADADSYDARILRRNNFSEDKRKYSHVTAMFGINQTDKEKEHALYRLNCLVGREGNLPETLCYYTAACLAIANPCVLAALER